MRKEVLGSEQKCAKLGDFNATRSWHGRRDLCSFGITTNCYGCSRYTIWRVERGNFPRMCCGMNDVKIKEGESVFPGKVAGISLQGEEKWWCEKLLSSPQVQGWQQQFCRFLCREKSRHLHQLSEGQQLQQFFIQIREGPPEHFLQKKKVSTTSSSSKLRFLLSSPV